MLQADIVERLYVETHLVTITTESVRCKSPTAIEAITEIAKETPKEVTKEDKAKENLPCKVVLKKLTKSNKYYRRYLDSVPQPPTASIPVVVEVKAPTAIEAITDIAKETPKEVTEEDNEKENLPCKVVLKKLTKSNKYYIEIRKNNRFLTSIFKKRCSL